LVWVRLRQCDANAQRSPERSRIPSLERRLLSGEAHRA
jgi:hypothetical protein